VTVRVGYVTTYDSADVGNWSGLGYFLRRALERAGCDVRVLGPLAHPRSLSVQAKRILHLHGRGGTYLPERHPRIGRAYAAQVKEMLTSTEVDVLFSPGTIPIAYLETPHPLVFWTDATFAAMRGFYPGFMNLSKSAIREGERMEQLALERADLALYASDWAAASARQHYLADAAKVKVVPFGANIEQEPTPDSVTTFVERRPRDRCRLVFIGVEWQRKGGDVAVEVARELNRRGMPSKLSVIGSSPVLRSEDRAFVDLLGFLDKGTTAGAARIEEELKRAHFLILPSRAECSALVLCEANAFGVPCITTNVGGIPTIVRDDVNGVVRDRHASPGTFADAILSKLAEPGAYRRMALSSYAEYRARLNWDVSGRHVKSLLDELVSGDRRGSR
jgi:glycosyltransferase involved in cell wall biosynthesis